MEKHTFLFHRHANDRLGYWGEPTATMDWCEENYALSHYVAEFWNANTNILFMGGGIAIAAYLWWIGGVKHRFPIAFLMLALVGFGSYCFHATLLYEWQLMDEVPMLFIACHVLYCLESLRRAWMVLTLALPSIISWYYHLSKNPVIHQVSFGIVLGIVILRCVQRFRWSTYNTGMSQWELLFGGVVFFGLGFACWLFDNGACVHLHKLRQNGEAWWSCFLQFHAWWHVLTFIGSIWVMFSVMVHVYGNGRGLGHVKMLGYILPVFCWNENVLVNWQTREPELKQKRL